MTKMVPTVSVGVARPKDAKNEKAGNKLVHPPIGVAFDFTKDEIDQINSAHPGALRKPVDESKAPEDTQDTNAGTATAAKGGAKSDTAPKDQVDPEKVNKTDGEEGGGKDGGKAAEDDDL